MNHPAKPRVSRWSDKGEEPARQDDSKRKEPPDEPTRTTDVKRKQPSEPSVKKTEFISGPCRTRSDHYAIDKKVGEGQYGAVYKGRCRETNEFVALKRFKLDHETEGFPITSIREAITLLKGKHPNVINVREIVFGNQLSDIYIVMDYMDRDLHTLMKDMTRPFKIAEVKLLMQQLLSAVAHLHNNWIIHRDLKTSNLLIHKGVLKVGDFGLAREYGSPLKQYTSKVVTLWYRAPELLLQTGKYSTPIDVWSVGCIFGELLIGKPLFRGQSEQQQIEIIFKALGSPTDKLWPDLEDIRLARRLNLPNYKYNTLLDMLEDKKALSDNGARLWNKLLAYDPGVNNDPDPGESGAAETGGPTHRATAKSKSTHRITAKMALEHAFFEEEPRPVHPSLFPTWPKDGANK